MMQKSLQDLKAVSSRPGFIQETLFHSGTMHYQERMCFRKDQANPNASSTWRQEIANLEQSANFIILETEKPLLPTVS